MTDLLSRPIRGVSPTPTAPYQPIVLTAAIAAAVTAAGGIIVMVAVSVIGWFSSDVGSFAGAVRIGLTGWLFGNGAGLVVAGTSITMLPLGLLLMFGWLLHRAGRWTAGRLLLADLRDTAVACGAFAATYVGVALVAYVVARSGGGHTIGWRSVAVPLVLAVVAGGSGMLRRSGLGAALIDRLPDEARAALTGGIAGISGLLAASALLFTFSMIVHFQHAVRLAEGLHAGVFGGIVLALLGLAFAPNAIVCAAGYLAGPGFAVGSGTEVSPGRVDLGPLPAHPLFAALPESAGAWWQSGLLLVPVLAGAIAGVVAVRRLPVTGLDRTAIRGGLAALAAAVAFALLLALAGGAIGPGRMQDVGPDLLPILGLGGLSVLIGGVVGAVAYGWLAKARSVDSLS